jgi:hypothetical protein
MAVKLLSCQPLGERGYLAIQRDEDRKTGTHIEKSFEVEGLSSGNNDDEYDDTSNMEIEMEKEKLLEHGNLCMLEVLPLHLGMMTDILFG